MPLNGSLSNENTLTVLCRIEPGCLGPDGKDHIEGFCLFAQKAMPLIAPKFVSWVIVPRYDKTLPEIQYQLNDRKLTFPQFGKYLEMLEHDPDEFSTQLDDNLANLIDRYLSR
jgi:hypothetical protein